MVDSRNKNLSNASTAGAGAAAVYTMQHKGGIPRIPLDMYKHKMPLLITTVVLMTLNGWLPPGLYYILKDAAKTSNTVAVTVPSVVFGVFSYYSGGTRLYSLLKKNSTTRPIGATRRHLDYFMWNFIVLFVAETAMIAFGSSYAGKEDPTQAKYALRVVSMALSVIILVVCVELIGVWVIMTLSPHSHYPTRFSSMTPDYTFRPAVYTIIEDVVAVDGKQGTAYRQALNDRYEYSEDIRRLMKWADGAWGITGFLVAGGSIAVSWVVHDPNYGWIVGWAAPWVWAWTMTLLTIWKTKRALRSEEAKYGAASYSSPSLGSPGRGNSPTPGAHLLSGEQS